MTDCTNLRLGTFDLSIIENFPTLNEVMSTAHPESFQFNVGSDFSIPNDTYLVGLAKVNYRGQVAPVASVCNVPSFPERDHRAPTVGYEQG